jgi:RNA polymerase sigma factor (sigma-70 family)
VLIDYLPLVRSIARKLRRMVRIHMELDELVSAGVLGLAEAAARFDPSAGNCFTTYAYHRIRGSMCDAITASAPLRRSFYRKGRAVPVSLESYLLAGNEIPATETNPETEIADAIDGGRARRRVQLALRDLDERERKLLTGYYLDGEALTDLSDELRIRKSWARGSARTPGHPPRRSRLSTLKTAGPFGSRAGRRANCKKGRPFVTADHWTSA